MFGLFHKKEQKALELGAPVSGQAVPLQEVSDPTFGGEILGKGVAVRPTDGRIYAPADGEITLLFDTLACAQHDDGYRGRTAAPYWTGHRCIKGCCILRRM